MIGADGTSITSNKRGQGSTETKTESEENASYTRMIKTLSNHLLINNNNKNKIIMISKNMMTVLMKNQKTQITTIFNRARRHP